MNSPTGKVQSTTQPTSPLPAQRTTPRVTPAAPAEDMREKAHYIAVTGIISKKEAEGSRRYLICQRSEQERIFPLKWCVPGGRVMQSDFINTPKDTADHWFGVFERVLEKEIREETGIDIKNIGYVSNLALIRPNGYSTIIVSLYGTYAGGDVQLRQRDELIDHAWVTLDEAKDYDLIENIWEQMEKVEEKYKSER